MNLQEKWITSLRNQPGRDNDAVVIITGKEGVGKSTFARWLARQLDGAFDSKQVVFSGADFMELAVKLQPGRVIILDEATEGGYSRDAMTTRNKELTKFLMVSRQRNLISIILFPNIRWLDPYISEHRASHWCLIEKRGVALVHRAKRADYKGAKPSWAQMFRSAFPKEEGADWDAYKAAKAAMVKRAGRPEEAPFKPDPKVVARLVRQYRLILQHR